MSEALAKTEKLERKDLPIDLLDPNPLNPNKMSDGEFNKLCDNMNRLGWTDACLVVPKPDGRYRIVGGHHRVEAGKFLGFKVAPCVVINDPNFDEEQEQFQLVRHNMIHGKLSPSLFLELYKKYADKYPEEVLQDAFGFSDKAEFQKLINQTKKNLPKEMQPKFNEAVKEIKTIDGLAALVNRLFTDYGKTLGHNYMVFDYQGKECVWVRCTPANLKDLYAVGELCHTHGVTLDAVMAFLVKRASTNAALQDEISKLPKNAEPLAKTSMPLLDKLNEK